ncbi:MAG: ComEA family DNA-binding protein [Flavobacteriales bacterium]
MPTVLSAQTEEQKNSIIEQRIEQIAGSLDEGVELDYTTLFEYLMYCFEHPLNINTADVDELRELFMLSDLQINALSTHIKRYGKLKSIYELQAVNGFDLATIRDIEPFVTVIEGSGLSGVSFKTIMKEGTHDMFFRYKRILEDQAGFVKDPETGKAPFLGSPDYLYTRYRFQFRKNLIAGFTMEKDPGETFDNGPDFTSFHVMYAGNGLVRKALAGDYQILFGQGLTFWNGLGFGKSPYILNVKKNALGVRPYTSVQEGNFLRGGAVTLGVKNFELTSFYSFRKVDANLVFAIDTIATDDDSYATSINISGLHRTESELADKGSMEETIYGGNLRYNTRSFSAGFTAVRTQFGSPLLPSISLYEINRFTGDHNLNMGFDYQAVIRNFNVFGEFSRSENGGMASVNGLVSALHPALSVSLVHRYFQPEYQALRVNVFGENNTTANNEHALFAGAQATLNSRWTLTAYSDLVRYPWLRFRVDAPSDYADHLVQLNYKPDRKHEFYLRYRSRNNVQNSDRDDLDITYPVDMHQQNFRLHGSYQAHPNVVLKTRAEWLIWDKEAVKERGFLVYQDLQFKKLSSPVTFTMRYAIFDSPNWNSRIYAYENDVLYAFSIPAYYGRGSRFYAMIKWDVTRKIDLWVRYGTFIYNDRNVLSSGTSEILGNRKSDVHIQIRLRM